jgi:serine phosphatase RsbU (regulator of sigma subunit)
VANENAADQSQDAIRTKRDFLAHLRHELRTPINAVNGYSEMLIEELTDEGETDIIPDLRKINQSGQQLLSVVNTVLDPARIESILLDPSLELSTADLHHELRTPLNAVMGYSEMLIEDLTDRGEDRLVADLRRIHASAEKMIPLIDYLVNISRTETEAMESDLETAGVSTIIRNVENVIHPAEPAQAAGAKVKPGHLLVVDDLEVNRDMLSRRLQHDGHTVVQAENGAAALEIMGAQKFDLVLLDIMMPEMNGYQVLERMKAHDQWRDVPVIMISALFEIDSVVKAIELGAEDYLPKPFNPVLLRARIGACLEKKRLREAQREQQMAEEKRLRRELELAAKVQRQLLPERPPELKEAELAGACYPALEVGGDYYDFLLLRDDQLGFAIADVAGKGMQAALLMSSVEASLRSRAPLANGSLSELVSALNELVRSWTGAGSFVTFFYAQFDPRNLLLTYVNAGHNPPLLVRRKKSEGETARELIPLTGGGPVIGIIPGMTYEQRSIQMQSGDILVAFTDGITEAFNTQNEEFGDRRLREAIDSGDNLSPRELMDGIISKVRQWCSGAPQSDDMTMVVMKVK